MLVVEQWAGFTAAVLDERYCPEARLNGTIFSPVLASPSPSLLFVSLSSAEACRLTSALNFLVRRAHSLASALIMSRKKQHSSICIEYVCTYNIRLLIVQSGIFRLRLPRTGTTTIKYIKYETDVQAVTS